MKNYVIKPVRKIFNKKKDDKKVTKSIKTILLFTFGKTYITYMSLKLLTFFLSKTTAKLLALSRKSYKIQIQIQITLFVTY